MRLLLFQRLCFTSNPKSTVTDISVLACAAVLLITRTDCMEFCHSNATVSIYRNIRTIKYDCDVFVYVLGNLLLLLRFKFLVSRFLQTKRGTVGYFKIPYVRVVSFDFTEKSSTGDANRYFRCHKCSCILWKQKIKCCFHKSQ